MLTISPKDKSNIDSFPLKWRWTSTSHALLSNEELNSIEPLSEQKATEFHNLLTLLFKKQSNLPYKEMSAESSTIVNWLTKYILVDIFIFLSCNSSTAIRIPTSLFIQRFDDFCYPSSDDIFIYPESGKWILEYHHHDMFTWMEQNDT